MNTRTRWSGVKITSVSAITSQASPRLVVTKITDAGLAGSGPEAIPRILRAEGRVHCAWLPGGLCRGRLTGLAFAAEVSWDLEGHLAGRAVT